MSRRKWIVSLVMGITFMSGVARAGDNPVRQCIADARVEKKTCDQVCKDDFLAAVDSCRMLNHDCAEQARADRKTCVTDVLTALRQCVEEECNDLGDGIAECKSQFPAGSRDRDRCIDKAQVQRFKCRDTCRESVELWKNLKACRAEFKADIQACKPAPPPPPMPPAPMGP